VSYVDGMMFGVDWELVVVEVVCCIMCGDVDKVVFVCDFEVCIEYLVDLWWLLRGFVDGYEGCWIFVVDGFVGVMFELFVCFEWGFVYLWVFVGMIWCIGDDVYDLVFVGLFVWLSKDFEEYEYVVWLFVDVFVLYCMLMNVFEVLFVLYLLNVMYLVIDVVGVLVDGAMLLVFVVVLYFIVVVGGIFIFAVVQLICDFEGMDCGCYVGFVGWIDCNGDGEWGIVLWCVEFDVVDLYCVWLFAGCGIVVGLDF